MNATQKQAAMKDLARFFSQKMSEVTDDIVWRCEALDLDGGEFCGIMIQTLSWPLAQYIAALSPSSDDRRFLSIMDQMIKYARHDLARKKKAEAEAEQ